MKISYFSNSQKYLYDLQHLIRAFFPNDEVIFGSGGEIHFECNFVGFFVKIMCVINGKIEEEKCFYLKEDEHESKRIFGRRLYDILKIVTKKELPWGILTGIRPTKIAAELMKRLKEDDVVLDFLKQEYCIMDKKANLLLKVAKKEEEILEKIDHDAAALYIGIPICPTRCLYCSFSCQELTKNMKDRLNLYTQTLLKELEKTYEAIKLNKNRIIAVYIGGGSPAVLGVKNVSLIFDSILSNLDIDYIKEITFEAGRPDTIDDELVCYLSFLNKKANLRLCINPQTSNDKTLDIIKRGHTFDDIVFAFDLSRRYLMDNINSDIILGLPNENEDHFIKSINDILSLNPSSITIHTLSIKRASILRLKWHEHFFMDEASVNNLLDWVYDKLCQNGYFPYYMYRQKNMIGNFENVGYCKEGYEGIYNVMIMQERHNIYACGAKAVSKFVYENNRIERVFNPSDIDIYISRNA